MLNSHQVVSELQKLGFVLKKDNARIKGLLHPENQIQVYVKAGTTARPVDNAPLVIHPDYLDQRQAIDATGVRSDGMYHNSNMTNYPKRQHTGANPISYGLDIGIPSLAALQALVSHLTGTASADSFADIQQAKSQLEGLDATTRQQLIDARRGQGAFRAELERLWNACCCVTGVAQTALLRASHIKPWRDSTHRERLDPDNGLLLVANLDAAFDTGLISFNDNGTIMLSPRLAVADALAAGIHNDLAITAPLSPGQQHYLQHHRDHIFRK